MGVFLTLAFLFFIGSVAGWGIEVVFRRFCSSSNPEHKWINPGFCTGPYLPLYGFGLCMLFLIARLGGTIQFASAFWSKAAVFLTMAVAMTAIEYVAGFMCLKLAKVRLWDYTGLWGNIQGIICPLFSFFWAILGAIYYFFIDPYIMGALMWLSNNLAFSFVIGLFFGVFLIDVAHSAQLVAKLKHFADENKVIVRYEAIKSEIRRRHDQTRKKYNFFRPFRTDFSLLEHLQDLKASFESWRNSENQ